MAEKFWYLKSAQVFQRLSDDDLRTLENRSRSTTFPRGSPIYLPSERAEAVFLLASGRVKICHITPDGKQSILALIDPGELFGELAIYAEGSARDEYAEAAEAATVVMIPGPEIQRLMEKRTDLSLGITKLIGLRRQRIERRLKNLLFRSNLERLTHLILELVELHWAQELLLVTLTSQLE